MLYYTIVFVLTYIQGKKADMSDDTQVEENPPLLDAAGLCTYTCLIFFVLILKFIWFCSETEEVFHNRRGEA